MIGALCAVKLGELISLLTFHIHYSADVRSKKLNSQSVSEKNHYKTLLAQYTKERGNVEDRITDLTIRRVRTHSIIWMLWCMPIILSLFYQMSS